MVESRSIGRPRSFWPSGVQRRVAALGAGLALAWMQINAATNVATQALTNAVPAKLQDIKEPIVIRSPWMWVRLGLFLVVLGGLLALAWWWWNRGRKPAPAGPGESPADRARRRLTAALDQLHDPERFATRVSEIARTYLEERFGLRAPERTTEEFLSELTTSVSLDSRHKALLGEFLTSCDLVKFARAEPSRAELEALHDAAERLVEETAPRPMVAPPVTGTPGGGT